MRTLIAATFALVVPLLLVHQAFAFSTRTGDSVSGSFANLADPDEQYPPFLRPLGGSTAATDNLDDDHAGQGFIRKDVIQQSVARGSGSYLPPEDNKEK